MKVINFCVLNSQMTSFMPLNNEVLTLYTDLVFMNSYYFYCVSLSTGPNKLSYPLKIAFLWQYFLKHFYSFYFNVQHSYNTALLFCALQLFISLSCYTFYNPNSKFENSRPHFMKNAFIVCVCNILISYHSHNLKNFVSLN